MEIHDKTGGPEKLSGRTLGPSNPDALGLKRYCQDNGKTYEDLTQWEINTYVIKHIAKKL